MTGGWFALCAMAGNALFRRCLPSMTPNQFVPNVVVLCGYDDCSHISGNIFRACSVTGVVVIPRTFAVYFFS